MGDVQFDDESGEGDTMVVERERDLALSAQARQTVADIDAALVRIADGTYGYSIVSGSADPARAPGGDPVGDRCWSRRRSAGSAVDDRPDATGAPRPVAPRPRRCRDRGSRRRSSTSSPSTGRVSALGDGHDGARRLDAAVQPRVQQRDGVLARARARAVRSASSPLVVIVVLLVVARAFGRVRWFTPSPSGWSIGGAIGNLLDRLFRGDGWLRGRWSTSSTCSGGRSSTSPTWRSRSAACCCC